MFCPVCESEYEESVTRCPDDDTELVQRLDPATSHDDSEAKFKALHRFNAPAEAEMVNDILRQNGIRSAVQSGALDALSPLLSSVGPGAAVLVDQRDYDRALELYTAFFGDDASPLTGGEGEMDEDEDELDK
ncbi:MAG TPA: DUF2007 domain-containing protein [Pyrinomonadaceae bacterium]|nr:DUF2007 domain-containing protein [Pyrinomonadaceae bacterium]